MRFKWLAALAGVAGIALAALGACKSEGPPMSVAAPAAGRSGRAAPAPEGAVLAAAQVARLAEPPFTELAFVPADAEALVRVDLAALAGRNPASPEMLDFLLRAQQPAAWEVLSAAGLSLGRHIRAAYLIVGARARVTSALLIAGVGQIDVARAGRALQGAGGIREAAAGGAALFVWHGADGSRVGGHDQPTGLEEAARDVAVGVADGLVLFGTPEMVRRAFAVRAGEGKDVRQSPLAAELLAAVGDGAGATAWGAVSARSQAQVDDAYLPELVPGLERAHFHAVLDPAEAAGLVLRAEFAAPAQAQACRDRLAGLVAQGADLARGTPMGAALARLRDGARLAVEGNVLTAAAKL